MHVRFNKSNICHVTQKNPFLSKPLFFIKHENAHNMHCAICHDETRESRWWCRTPCEHYICPPCLSEWMKQPPIAAGKPRRCPECSDALPARFNINTLVRGATPLDIAVDAETQRWLAGHAQRCPKCRTWIEKSGGCEEMMCMRCGHAFCWNCMADADGRPHRCLVRICLAAILPGAAAQDAAVWVARHPVACMSMCFLGSYMAIARLSFFFSKHENALKKYA